MAIQVLRWEDIQKVSMFHNTLYSCRSCNTGLKYHIIRYNDTKGFMIDLNLDK